MHSFREQLPEKSLEWVTRSQVRLGEMLTIIQDWLALAKIDRGALCDRNARTEILGLVRDLIQSQQQLPESADIRIETETESELPNVAGDPVSIGMVIGNLISNAVKYNHPGGSVRVKLCSKEGFVDLEVRDTGIGIPEDCIPRLFEEFYRVRSDQTQDIPGTGLGLVICKRILEELGGSILVESKSGVGTAVLVRFPAIEKEAGTTVKVTP